MMPDVILFHRVAVNAHAMVIENSSTDPAFVQAVLAPRQPPPELLR
jgi:hypothetical protein